jgi:4-amino-4-deoxy-L-arabinose transferase-like glycosyltransferase
MASGTASVYSRDVTAEGAPPEDPEASGRLLFALALLAGALLRLVLLGRPDLFGADEGAWAVGARNLVEGGLAQIVALSDRPLGAPAGTPILLPGVLSIMVRVFGPEVWAIRLPSAFAGLVGAFVLERIVRRGWGQPAGHLAGAFAALLPPLVSSSRVATVEPTLVALGLGGIIFGLRAFEEDLPWEGALAGFLFGLGFLAKGYAVGLYLLPLLAALVARPRLFALGRTRRSLGLLLLFFVLTGSVQLVAVALFRPGLFGFQLATLFGASEAAVRAAAQPTAFGADLKSLVATLFFFLPLGGLGLAFLARPVGEDEIASGATGGDRRLDHGILWGAFLVELVAIVAVAGKLKLSSIPVMPVVAALAGLGGTALLRLPSDRTRRWREAAAAAAAGIVVLGASGLFVASPVDPLFGGRARPFDVTAALLAIAGLALLEALLAAGFLRRLLRGRFALVVLSGLLVAGGVESARAIRFALLTHRTGAGEAASEVAPFVASAPPQTVSLRGAEREALEFLLFRTCGTWQTLTTPDALFVEEAAGAVKVWIYASAAPPGPLAPPAAVREALAATLRDVTGEVNARAGRTTGLRVFVRR